jgi:hypothetical protein
VRWEGITGGRRARRRDVGRQLALGRVGVDSQWIAREFGPLLRASKRRCGRHSRLDDDGVPVDLDARVVAVGYVRVADLVFVQSQRHWHVDLAVFVPRRNQHVHVASFVSIESQRHQHVDIVVFIQSQRHQHVGPVVLDLDDLMVGHAGTAPRRGNPRRVRGAGRLLRRHSRGGRGRGRR